MIVFQNKGKLDVLSIKTFGISAKETDNPIGFFGTGLKYAIAVLLRTGHDVTILSGSDVYRFGVERATLRNTEFAFITLNGEKLAYTTELGKTWELWQAFRELYSNMLDESGRCWREHNGSEVLPEDNEVNIVVEGEAFELVYSERAKYFLCAADVKPVFENENVVIYDKPSNGLFYRGILVGGMDNRSSRLTYNLKAKQALTEDRTIGSTWSAQWQISQALLQQTSERILKAALLGGDTSYEATCSLPSAGNPSDEFIAFVRKHKYDEGMLKGAITAAMNAPGGHSMFEAPACELFPHEKDILARAHKLLEKIQAPIRYSVVVTEALPTHTLAYVMHGGDTIYLNRLLLSQGVTRVACGLFEENAHLQRGLVDETRAMQNFFLETLMGVVERLP